MTTPSLTGLVLFLAQSSLTVAQSLSALHIPLQLSSNNQHYVASVNMSVGDNTQRFGFALSTSTGYTLVANTSCASCASNNIPTYNISQSTTAAPIGSGQQQQSVSVLGGAIAGAGILSKENCSLRQSNGSYWNYPNQTIVRSSSSPVFQAGVSGLIGLGTGAPFGDTVGGGWLGRNPAQQSFTFGLALDPPPSQNIVADGAGGGGAAGTLHMLQPDPGAFNGAIQWQPAQPVSVGLAADANATAGGESSWVVKLDGWNARTGASQTSNAQGGQAAVEPFFTNIFMPSAQALQIYASVTGALAIQNGSSALAGQMYSIPCDTDITFSAVLGGQEYSVPKEALVLRNPDGSCVGAIEGWNSPTYLLGSRFISAVYMVFQVDRNMQQQIGLARRVQVKPARVGAIVGGTVGGVVLLLLAGGAIFWFVLRKRPATRVQPRSEKSQLMSGGAPQTPEADRWSLGLYTPTPAPSSDAYHTQPASPGNNYDFPAGYPAMTPTTATAHDGSNAPLQSPPPTATSMSSGFSDQAPQRLSQWVTSLRPTSGKYVNTVPTQYDYGNQGEPGARVTPRLPRVD